MDTAEVKRCKGCGFVFDKVDGNIDKCADKRIYCDLCLAQKNPQSVTERKIKKKYILITALSAFVFLIIVVAVNWGKNKNDNFLEYFVGFGLGYLLIWIVTALLLFPLLRVMKKPHKAQIEKEKERYIEETEKKKEFRKIKQE